MSLFTEFAKKVDKLARDTFTEYKEAEAALKKAEDKARQYPERSSGNVTPEYLARSARAKADLLEAQGAIHAAQKNMNARNSDIAAIRKELATALRSEYSAKTSELDSATLELLKSGVLRGDEYAKLLHDAQEEQNYTMSRLIGHYAADSAEKAAKTYGETDQRVRELRVVAYQGNTDGVDNKLAQFDVLADVFRRTSNNPAMISHWQELTGEIIEAF